MENTPPPPPHLLCGLGNVQTFQPSPAQGQSQEPGSMATMNYVHCQIISYQTSIVQPPRRGFRSSISNHPSAWRNNNNREFTNNFRSPGNLIPPRSNMLMNNHQPIWRLENPVEEVHVCNCTNCAVPPTVEAVRPKVEAVRPKVEAVCPKIESVPVVQNCEVVDNGLAVNMGEQIAQKDVDAITSAGQSSKLKAACKYSAKRKLDFSIGQEDLYDRNGESITSPDATSKQSRLSEDVHSSKKLSTESDAAGGLSTGSSENIKQSNLFSSLHGQSDEVESLSSDLDIDGTGYHPIALPLGCFQREDSDTESGTMSKEKSLGSRMEELGQEKYNLHQDKTLNFRNWNLVPILRETRTKTKQGCRSSIKNTVLLQNGLYKYLSNGGNSDPRTALMVVDDDVQECKVKDEPDASDYTGKVKDVKRSLTASLELHRTKAEESTTVATALDMGTSSEEQIIYVSLIDDDTDSDNEHTLVSVLTESAPSTHDHERRGNNLGSPPSFFSPQVPPESAASSQKDHGRRGNNLGSPLSFFSPQVAPESAASSQKDHERRGNNLGSPPSFFSPSAASSQKDHERSGNNLGSPPSFFSPQVPPESAASSQKDHGRRGNNLGSPPSFFSPQVAPESAASSQKDHERRGNNLGSPPSFFSPSAASSQKDHERSGNNLGSPPSFFSSSSASSQKDHQRRGNNLGSPPSFFSPQVAPESAASSQKDHERRVEDYQSMMTNDLVPLSIIITPPSDSKNVQKDPSCVINEGNAAHPVLIGPLLSSESASSSQPTILVKDLESCSAIITHLHTSESAPSSQKDPSFTTNDLSTLHAINTDPHASENDTSSWKDQSGMANDLQTLHAITTYPLLLESASISRKNQSCVANYLPVPTLHAVTAHSCASESASSSPKDQSFVVNDLQTLHVIATHPRASESASSSPNDQSCVENDLQTHHAITASESSSSSQKDESCMAKCMHLPTAVILPQTSKTVDISRSKPSSWNSHGNLEKQMDDPLARIASVLSKHMNKISKDKAGKNLETLSQTNGACSNGNTPLGKLETVNVTGVSMNAASSAYVTGVSMNAASSAHVTGLSMNAASSAHVTGVSMNAASSAHITGVSMNAASSAYVTGVSMNAASSAHATGVSMNAASSAHVTGVSMNAASSAQVTGVSMNAASSAHVTGVSMNAASSAHVTGVSMNAASSAHVEMLDQTDVVCNARAATMDPTRGVYEDTITRTNMAETSGHLNSNLPTSVDKQDTAGQTKGNNHFVEDLVVNDMEQQSPFWRSRECKLLQESEMFLGADFNSSRRRSARKRAIPKKLKNYFSGSTKLSEDFEFNMGKKKKCRSDNRQRNKDGLPEVNVMPTTHNKNVHCTLVEENDTNRNLKVIKDIVSTPTHECSEQQLKSVEETESTPRHEHEELLKPAAEMKSTPKHESSEQSKVATTAANQNDKVEVKIDEEYILKSTPQCTRSMLRRLYYDLISKATEKETVQACTEQVTAVVNVTCESSVSNCGIEMESDGIDDRTTSMRTSDLVSCAVYISEEDAMKAKQSIRSEKRKENHDVDLNDSGPTGEHRKGRKRKKKIKSIKQVNGKAGLCNGCENLEKEIEDNATSSTEKKSGPTGECFDLTEREKQRIQPIILKKVKNGKTKTNAESNNGAKFEVSFDSTLSTSEENCTHSEGTGLSDKHEQGEKQNLKGSCANDGKRCSKPKGIKKKKNQKKTASRDTTVLKDDDDTELCPKLTCKKTIVKKKNKIKETEGKKPKKPVSSKNDEAASRKGSGKMDLIKEISKSVSDNTGKKREKKPKFRVITDPAQVQNVMSNRPTECRFCKKTVPFCQSKNHEKEHIFRCVCCCLYFSSKEEKSEHFSEKHHKAVTLYRKQTKLKTVREIFHCVLCGKSFCTFKTLQRHLLSIAHGTNRCIEIRCLRRLTHDQQSMSRGAPEDAADSSTTLSITCPEVKGKLASWTLAKEMVELEEVQKQFTKVEEQTDSCTTITNYYQEPEMTEYRKNQQRHWQAMARHSTSVPGYGSNYQQLQGSEYAMVTNFSMTNYCTSGAPGGCTYFLPSDPGNGSQILPTGPQAGNTNMGSMSYSTSGQSQHTNGMLRSQESSRLHVPDQSQMLPQLSTTSVSSVLDTNSCGHYNYTDQEMMSSSQGLSTNTSHQLDVDSSTEHGQLGWLSRAIQDIESDPNIEVPDFLDIPSDMGNDSDPDLRSHRSTSIGFCSPDNYNPAVPNVNDRNTDTVQYTDLDSGQNYGFPSSVSARLVSANGSQVSSHPPKGQSICTQTQQEMNREKTVLQNRGSFTLQSKRSTSTPDTGDFFENLDEDSPEAQELVKLKYAQILCDIRNDVIGSRAYQE